MTIHVHIYVVLIINANSIPEYLSYDNKNIIMNRAFPFQSKYRTDYGQNFSVLVIKILHVVSLLLAEIII